MVLVTMKGLVLLLLLFVALGIVPWASSMLYKYSTTQLQLQLLGTFDTDWLVE